MAQGGVDAAKMKHMQMEDYISKTLRLKDGGGLCKMVSIRC